MLKNVVYVRLLVSIWSELRLKSKGSTLNWSHIFKLNAVESNNELPTTLIID